MRKVRLISEGIAAVVQGRIAEAVAADTGRCRLHCSIVSNPQLVIWPVTSCRQNSAALACFPLIAPSAAMAIIAATGATFKFALIIISSWCGFDQPRSLTYVARDGCATTFNLF